MCLFSLFYFFPPFILFCYVNSLSSPSNWIVDSLCLECCLSVPYGSVENAVTNISHSLSSTEISKLYAGSNRVLVINFIDAPNLQVFSGNVKVIVSSRPIYDNINPLNAELNPICYLLALLGAHHFLHVSRIRVKLLTFKLLMSYIYGAPILDVSRSHTTTQHSR